MGEIAVVYHCEVSTDPKAALKRWVIGHPNRIAWVMPSKEIAFQICEEINAGRTTLSKARGEQAEKRA